MSEYIDCIVIGAGVIGLACARRLALTGRETIVLEQHDTFGAETSSRNSEVIHAGIYYPPTFLKTSLCVSGKHALYVYCREREIAHKKMGKIIVASDEKEKNILEKYYHQATKNGVCDLEILNSTEISELEPGITGTHGLFSPSSGIIDSHEYMQCLLADLEYNNGMVVYRSRVKSIRYFNNRFQLEIDGEEQFEIECRELVNSAGLYAWDIAQFIAKSKPLPIPPRYYAKGHYFSLVGRSPFSYLIYPVPNSGGLGTHVTLDMGGQVKFGPDLRWVDKIDYRFDDSIKPDFIREIRKYYPDIDEREIQPSYTGIRAKVTGPGDGPGDFIIQTAAEHDLTGLVNLYGIDSPGLTASLSIAEKVLDGIQ